MAINFGTRINLAAAANLIAECGKDITFVLAGEPGIGKSSVLHALKDKFPEHRPVYLDSPLLDLGDLRIPFKDTVRLRSGEERTITRFAPNEMLGFHDERPVLVMLDEIGKANRSVKNVLNRLMLEHALDGDALPEGSVVFATTNLSTDGVGDELQAHTRNRVTYVHVRKPDSEEWIEWATLNDVAPEVITWAKERPQAFGSYTVAAEAEEGKEFIYNPTTPQTAYVTPRSLAKASHLIKARAHLGAEALIASLAGTVGEAAARDMQAFLSIADKLPSFDEIVRNPKDAQMPGVEAMVPLFMLTYGLVMRVSKDTLSPVVQYMERAPKELQALFIALLLKNSAKAAWAMMNKTVTQWAVENARFV